MCIIDVTAKGVELVPWITKNKRWFSFAHGEEEFGLALYMKTRKVLFSIRKFGQLLPLHQIKRIALLLRFLVNYQRIGL